MITDLKAPVNFIVCLRKSEDFHEGHVRIMESMVKRHFTHPVNFIALTDVEGLGKPLEEDWQGWWCLLESFKIQGPCIVTGLDTVILDNMDRFAELVLSLNENDFVMLRPFNRQRVHGRWASGFMMWNGDAQWILDDFLPARDVPRFHYEQAFTSSRLAKAGINVLEIQDHIPGIYSYKRHCRKGLPQDAAVVLFHGQPRPQEAPEEWVKENWK